MSERADQLRCTERVLAETPDAAVVSNLGVASCLLAAVDDRPENLYLWGSMGTTTSVGLGVARETDRQVTVLDGDGSTLMALGTLATVARYGPANLVVVVFDNEVYATTGGQPTNSESTDIAAAARACGLRSEHVSSDEAFGDRYAAAVTAEEPVLIVCEVDEATPDQMPPREFPAIAHRFRESVGSAAE